MPRPNIAEDNLDVNDTPHVDPEQTSSFKERIQAAKEGRDEDLDEELDEPEADEPEVDEPEADETEETDEPEAEGDAAEPAEEGAAAVEGEYKPDFSYRAGGEDKELPEYVRSLIKDAESEQQIKTLFAKADGLETVSRRRDEYRNERDQIKQTYDLVQNEITTLKKHYERDDLDSFFDHLKIPEEKVLQWAVQKAKYYQGDEAYRQRVDGEAKLRRDAFQKDTQAETYKKQYEDLETRQLQSEFNLEMMKSEVSQFASSFDKFAGKTGAFLEEVKNRGELAYLKTNKIVSPSEVIQGMIKQYGSIASAPKPAQPAAANPAGAKVVKQPAKKVATIPSVRSSQASPVQEGFTSIDAIREHRKALLKQQG